MNLQENMRLAAAHHQAGRDDEAERICRQTLAIQPDRADALHLSGLILWKRGRKQEAEGLIRRAITANPRQAGYQRNLGLLLMELGRPDEGLAALGRSLEIRPDSAPTHNDVGNALAGKGLKNQAMASFRQALLLEPKLPEALFNLANTLVAMERWEEAVGYFQQATAARPDWAQAHSNLGNILCRLGRVEEGIEAYQQALRLRPELAEIHNNLGNAWYALGDMDTAGRHYKAALGHDAQFAPAHWNISLIHLMKGEYERGWPLYEWRWKVASLGLNANVPGERWNGGDLGGRRILIHNEQGLGDVLQFTRYVPQVLASGGKVIISCSRPLVRLLRGQWPIEVVESGTKVADYDVQCPLTSLPLVMGTTLQTIPAEVPYIRADAGLSVRWKMRVPADGRKKVGLVWAGQRLPDPFRAATPAALGPIGKVEGVWLCSLQLGEKADAASGLQLADWTDELIDLAETAALIDNLDLVITVDTAVAHLAGAMGKPTWLLLKKAADWRWLMDREDSPWYPTMRLFRQEKLGDWQGPVRRIAAALGER